MDKKKTIIRGIVRWIISFVLVIVVINGVGTWTFEKRECSLPECIVEMEGVDVLGNGSTYKPQNEDAYIIFDFSTVAQEGVYGISLELKEKVGVNKFVTYFGNEFSDFIEDNGQKVTRDKNNVIESRYTVKSRYIKLGLKKTIDIDKANVIVKIPQTKLYAIAVLVALVVSQVCGMIDERRKKKSYQWKEILFKVIERKQIVTGIIVILELVGICIFDALCCICMSSVSLNPYRLIIYACFAFAITVAVRYKESVIKYFHIYYFFFVVMIGTINIISPPCSLDLSWDDQIHYSRANYIARGFKSYESEAGYQLSVNSLSLGSLNKENFPQEKREQLINYINGIDKDSQYDGLRSFTAYGLGSGAISYVPTAIGLVIGRGLGFSAINTLLFGKLVNLICYALIFSYSIYLLRKRGYIIAAFIGLIPTSVFLASSYSYDWWVTALTVLGYAIYANEYEEKKEVSKKTLMISIFVILGAILPKPAYLPILFPMLIGSFSKNKKESKSLKIIACIVVVLIGAFIFVGITKNGFNDTRGSLEVNASEQIKFILGNPISYAVILFRFIWGYITPDNINTTFGFLTAYGYGKFYTVILIVLTIGSVIDSVCWNDSENKVVNRLRISNLIGVFATVILIATAFYITYTAVGSDIIDGTQCRYLIPLFFPLIYYVCRVNTDISQMLKDKVLIVGCILMAAVLCYNIYFGCLVYY